MTGTPTVPAAVRTLPGPFGTRTCIDAADGYIWSEELLGDPRPYLDGPALAGLKGIPATTVVAPVLPSSVDGRTACWPPTADSALLFDTIFDTDLDIGQCERNFGDLGEFLAGVHRHPTDVSLPRRDACPPWLLARPEVDQQVARVRRELIRLAGPVVAGAAGRDLSTASQSLVHGRFSTALCALESSRLSVLGWREAGLGDPMQDLGYLLGELAEAIIVADMGRSGTTAHCGRSLTNALLSAYEDACGTSLTAAECHRLTAWAARRVVDHMAIHVVAYERVQGPVQLLRRADQALATLLSHLETRHD